MLNWSVTETQDEGAWLDDYIAHVIAHAPPSLPPHDQTIGSIEAHWHQIEPGVAHVVANPYQGTADDRRLAEKYVMAQLLPHGFKRAEVEMYWDHDDLRKVSEWGDIEDKARRLIQSGNVQLLRNGYNTIIGQVTGDHGNYKTEISRQDPNSQSITGSHCDCDWGQFQNLPRTRQWKRFQNRPCAHILATYWLSTAVPNDEDRAPGDQGGPGQMSLPGMGGPSEAPSSMGIMQRSPMPNPNAWFMQPGAPPNAFNQGPNTPSPAQAPAPADVLPPFPMEGEGQDMPPVNPASTPGGRPGPTPTDPIQYPGGTFSHVSADQQYRNGDLVRLKQETMGTLVGRSEEHGAGQSTNLPAGSVGEVLGTDPTTGMINVLFMGKQFDTNGQLEPYGATLWAWPSELTSSDNRPPGPAINRT